MSQDQEKLKRTAKKLVDNQGSTPLAQLDTQMDTNDKLDEIVATLKEKPTPPEVQKVEIISDENTDDALKAFLGLMKGKKGDTGDDGAQGDTGEKGPKGDTGSKGERGEKGIKGDRGETGLQGIQGIQGEKGDQGERGSADTPDEVFEKILKSDKLIPKEKVDIKNYDDDIATLQNRTQLLAQISSQRSAAISNNTIQGVGSTIIAQTSPGSNFLQANGQILNQADYPALYAQLGAQPDFKVGLKTVIPVTSANAWNVAYSSSLGLYVAVKNNSAVVYTSTDGLQWNLANSAIPWVGALSINWNSTFGMFFVGPSSGTAIYMSTDGITWLPSQVYSAGSSSSSTGYIASSSTTIVVAPTSDFDNSTEYVYTSTNGTTWTRRALGTSLVNVVSIYYSSDLSLFFIGGSSGQIYTSPDGITWTARTSNIASQINAFSSKSSLIVAVGSSGVISSSTDGLTWTARTTQTAQDLFGVAYSPTATIPWIATGANIILTSTNGTTWKTMYAPASNKSSIFYDGTSTYVRLGANQLLATSTDLQTWTAQTPATGGGATNTMRSGAFGNGAYVVVCAGGKIDSSSDAISWTNRTANAGSVQLNHVIYATGTINLFVAVGATNTIVTSPDGITWTARTANVTGNLVAVAFNQTGSILVAVSDSGKITRSTDGATWSAQTAPSTTSTLNGISWNGTVFCAVGNSGIVFTSADGSTWTEPDITGIGIANLSWITSDATNFYAISGVSNITYISSDTITWTPYGTPLDTRTGINWINSKLIGYSSSYDIATSTNGKQWTLIVNGGPGSGQARVFWFNSQFIVTGNTIAISTDGQIFKSPSYSEVGTDIIYSASQHKLVAVFGGGQGGMGIMYSTDGGTNWIPSYYTVQVGVAINSIAYSPSLDLFVAVFNSGAIITSPDGITWTQRIFTHPYLGQNPQGTLNSICWSVAKSLFITVGALGIIATSSDGITWTNRTSGVGIALNQICYNSSKTMFVIAGNTGEILTSTNGTTWVSRPTGSTRNFTAVASMESKGFLVGDSGGGLWFSADGITFTQYNSTTPVNNSAISKMFYSSVDNAVFIPQAGSSFSTAISFTQDGRNIQSIGIGASTTNFNAIAYDSVNDTYIAVGASGYIATLNRSYNKSTQFVLPALVNTWIKAS